jgi:outer membrane protein OmpA-like peptidoglycan-associated protein
VPDGIDQCPDTPADTQVDPRGCPMTEEAKILLDTGSLVLRDIQFEVNSAQLKPQAFPALEKVGTILAQWPELRLEVGGHTDSSGDAEYNRELSLKRAQSAADYIRDTYPTITEDQLEVKGYGEDQPIATNETREGKTKNRRVEFTVINPGVFEK